MGVAADTVSMSAAANAGRAEQCSSNAVQSELWPSLLLAFCGQDTSQPSGQSPSFGHVLDTLRIPYDTDSAFK